MSLRNSIASKLSKQDKNNFSALLDLVSAPDDLVGLIDVIENLKEILPIIESMDAGKVIGVNVNDLYASIELIDNKSGEIIKNNPCAQVRKEGPKQPPKGYVGDYPLYCAMLACVGDFNLNGKHRLLQAHFLYSAWSLIRRVQEGDAQSFQEPISRMGRAVRQLARLRYQFTLTALPEKLLTSEKYLSEVKEILNVTGDPDKKGYIEYIERVLRYVVEGGGGYTRSMTESSPAGYLSARSDTPERQSSDLTLGKECADSNITQREYRESTDAGLAPQESYAGPRYIEVKRKKPATSGMGHRLMQDRARIRQMDIKARALPNDWICLNQHDLAALFHELDGYLSTSSSSHDLATIALIILMLYTGRRLDDILKMYNVDNHLYITGHENGRLYLSRKDGVFGFAPNLPAERKRAQPEWRQYLHPTASKMLLRLPAEIVDQYVTPYLDSMPDNQAGELFPDAMHDELLAGLNQTIKRVNDQHDARLTRQRLENYLYYAVIHATGDKAQALLITGRDNQIGQYCALYYFAPPLHLLESAYLKAIARSYSSPDNDKLSHSSDERRIYMSDERVGSELVPTDYTMKELGVRMSANIEAYRDEATSLEGLRLFHNYYVTWCVQFLGLATGYRAVRDPIRDYSDIDKQTGLIVISDKDDDHYRNARLAWLPEKVYEQIDHYRRHRQIVLYDRLPHLKPWQDESSITSVLGDGWPFFFYLTEQYQYQQVRPKLVQKWMPPPYLPANVNRHYLRTNLIVRGCPPSIVDALMGHWGYGEEPYGAHASLSPAEFKSELKQPLEALIKGVDWEPIKRLK